MTPWTQGLVQIYTGDGKGKTTAAVGLAVRACGAGARVGFFQFVKGGDRSSELSPLEKLGVTVVRPAREGTGLLRGGATPADVAAAQCCFAQAREALLHANFDMVILDELCAAVRAELIDLNAVCEAIRGRKSEIEVVITGRGAPEPLLALADLVTRCQPDRHPWQRGVVARRGIEF